MDSLQYRGFRLATHAFYAMVFAFSIRQADAQGPVTIVNPGFEQADTEKPDLPLGWDHYPGKASGRLKFVWDNKAAHGGKRSVSIVLGEDNASWLPSSTGAFAVSLDKKDLVQTRPPVVVGHEYALTVWVKGKGSARKSAALVLRWTDDNGWVPKYTRESFQLAGNDWQMISISAVAPGGAKYICPILSVSANNEPGQIWYDDVSIVDRTGLSCEVAAPPELCALPNRWRCEVIVRSMAEQATALHVALSPNAPGAKPTEIKGDVSASKPLHVTAEYEAPAPHHVQCLVTSGDANRSIYFFSMIPAERILDAYCASPLYRSTIFGSSAGRTLRVHSTIHAAADVRAKMSLRAEVLVGEKPVAQKAQENPPSSGAIEIPLPELPPGDHKTRVLLQAGDQIVAQAELPLHCLPDVKPKSAIGDGNELLIDGKPVFPIGFYSTKPEYFNRFRKDGFNTVLTYSTDVEACAEMAKQADEAGLKLIVSAIHAYTEKRGPEEIRNAARTLSALPGVLGYYLCDEPTSGKAGQAPDDMHRLYEQAMADDPSHITCMVFCVPSEFRLYADTMDVFMVDPYPTFHDQPPGPDLTHVSDWVDKAREAVRDRKPVWLVPQCFDHLLGPGRYRMPTIEEQRCMCYLGIIHGAKGILWFTYTGFCIHAEEVAKKQNAQHAFVFRGTIPECWPLRWEGITRIVREVNELAPILLSADPKQTQDIVKGRDAVHCRLKASAQERYLFAVNVKNEPMDFACRLPGVAPATVLWENRTVDLKDGVLEDKFKPYEVHVYRFALKP